MIEIKNLFTGYGGTEVLKDVSISLPNGKITVIIGTNGCGKSTLIKSAAGILPFSKGDIRIDGESIKNLSTGRIAENVSYLPQNRQIPDITVMKMVLHGRFPYLGYPRCYRKSDIDIANKAIEDVGLSAVKDRSLKTLSGGTVQKVYIAMILAQDTNTVLLDEPTTFLDISMQIQLMNQIEDLARRGKAVAIVLHDLPMAMQIADNVAVMQNGKIVQEGKPEELYASGVLDSVFGVELGRVNDGAWRYYCRY